MKFACSMGLEQKRFFGGNCVSEAIKQISQIDLFRQENGCKCDQIIMFLHEPHKLEDLIRQKIAIGSNEVIVNGPFEQRIIIINYLNNPSIILTPQSLLSENSFIIRNKDIIQINDLNQMISSAKIPDYILENLRKPLVKLIALYHPENFPLPRFALGISDIARAVREEYLGKVTLSDMQLNKSVYDIFNEIDNENPDIIGISVTFGQQDVLEKLLSLLSHKPNYSPLIVIGGSLAALNHEHLVKKHSNVIVGLGDGESSMPDIINYWQKNITINEVNNVFACTVPGDTVKNPRSKLPSIKAGIPELDLLPSTLQQRGIMQLESTRGCSYACSFCPRTHKGIWSPQSIDLFEKILPEISHIYNAYPDIAKKIFLVDEEFVGYRVEDETNTRILNVCNTLNQHGFTFETSARVDQIYRRTKDKAWHVERLKLWNHLVNNGLDRVLFGVESGVDSILKRFNKNTMRFQNEYAIRIVSSSAIPVRLTYITFDPLMSMEELIESYHFQGRKDLLLKPLKHLSEEEIFEGIHDETFVTENARGQRLYQEISYMLVSMECLIGSKYLRKVEEAGLAKEYNYSMGKRNAEYLDKRIGFMSYNAQLWVDRNFALDYTIKSLEKISSKSQRPLIRELRHVVKDFSYGLFGQFLALMNKDLSLIPTDLVQDVSIIKSLIKQFDYSLTRTIYNQAILEELMNEHFINMKEAFEIKYLKIKESLSEVNQSKMDIIADQWKTRKEWRLINAA